MSNFSINNPGNEKPDIGRLFHEGRLAESLKAANDAVRQAPASAEPRILLAELLLFDGNLDRADVVLEAAAGVDPSASLVVAEFRQLLRAAMGRRQVLREGKLPEFLGEPTASQKCLLQGLMALRAGDERGAAKAAKEAELVRPAVTGRHADAAFADWRDADDLWAGSFEILTTTGKYFWVPTERVASLDFHAPVRLRDLLWRRCSMVVRDGPDGDVYMPALYNSALLEHDKNTLQLGQETAWTDSVPVRGIGQRIFLAGDAGVSIHEMTDVEFMGVEAGKAEASGPVAR